DMSKHFGDMVQFESMQEFEKLLAQPRVSGRDDSSNSGSEGFTGTKDYKESEQFRQYGDEKSANSLHKYKATVDDMIEKPIRPRNKTFDDVVGFQPIVPNALMGLPKSMMNQKRTEQKGKVMRIFADMGFNAGTDKEDIAYRGALIMTAIQQLEITGVRVELWVGVT
ncbi:hypothetical protein RF640_19090, partial [Kocuria sp. CPCC 205231]|uniref:DUF7192 family protein n=1 Tax=Kocuria sp. CPCC 205231 TaxID=3073551 RepID=UPI0034D63D48